MGVVDSAYTTCFCVSFLLLGLRTLSVEKPVTVGSVVLLGCMSASAASLVAPLGFDVLTEGLPWAWRNATAGGGFETLSGWASRAVEGMVEGLVERVVGVTGSKEVDEL